MTHKELPKNALVAQDITFCWSGCWFDHDDVLTSRTAREGPPLIKKRYSLVTTEHCSMTAYFASVHIN
jgi:hypothetical protein